MFLKTGDAASAFLKKESAPMERMFLTLLAAVNLAAFLLYGLDKWKARRHSWRIPEKWLLGVAAAGGALGSYLGMTVFRHKTLHRKFVWGVPILLALQAGALFYGGRWLHF